MPELDSRPLLGYPDAEVSLHFDDGAVTVLITDHRGTTRWEPSEATEAREMFHHPFAYGYVYPPHDEQDRGEEDGA